MKIFRSAYLLLVVLSATLFISVVPVQAAPVAQTPNFPFTATVTTTANLRGGPGTIYAIVGGRQAGEVVQVVRCGEVCDWYQLATGEWIAAFLVNAEPTAILPDATSGVLPAAPTVNTDANLRGGPGTNYPIVGSAKAGQSLSIGGRNEAGDWYQLADGNWVAAFLVTGAPTTLPVAPTYVQVSEPLLAVTATPAPQPIVQPVAAPSGGRTGAVCRDGTLSSATGRGACSHHGGVDHWLY